MKLNLLLATSLITGAAFGQFTQTNEPAIGTILTMYVLDSNAVNYSASAGTAQTWDYSNTPGISSTATKTVSVITPTSTDYPSSTKAIDIPGFMTSYFTSSASGRISQGFEFNGGALAGPVAVVFSGDPETLMNYPFAYGSTLTDNFAGTAETSLGSFATTGNITASVDGTGTLKLYETTLNNITRYKLVDHASANTGVFGNIIMDRVQYEYYDLTTPGLPIFVHSTLTITIGTTPTVQHLVLSAIEPGFLGVSENEKAAFGLFPNPAKETVTISGLNGNESISIVDMSGRSVLSAQNSGTSQELNISDLKAGVYTVVVTANGVKSTKKLTIN